MIAQIVDFIFKSCCGIVYLIGSVFSLNYHETNTYLFLYIQPILCWILTFILLITVLKKVWNNLTMSRALLTLVVAPYFVIITAGLNKIAHHYWSLSASEACKLAMREMHDMANYGMSYQEINIMLFIVLFLIIVGLDIIGLAVCKHCFKSVSQSIASRTFAVLAGLITTGLIGILLLIGQLPKNGIEPNYTIVEIDGKQYLKQEGLITGYNDNYPDMIEFKEPPKHDTIDGD